jgi:hypothetical protein
MANNHLKNRTMTLKAKVLLSLMLSLPDDWDYTLKGLSLISVESIDAIREAVRELERAGYIVRSRERNEKGQLKGADYVIYEQPSLTDMPPVPENPALENPILDNPAQEKPVLGPPMQENPTQLNTNRSKTNSVIPEKLNTHGANPYPSNLNPSYPYTWSAQNTGSDEMGYDEAQEYRRTRGGCCHYDPEGQGISALPSPEGNENVPGKKKGCRVG